MTMRLRFAVFVLLALLAMGSARARAQVVKVVVDDTIQPISEEYIDRAIAHADKAHADAVLIELRTPGGLDGAMRGIISKMLASPVPVIVYVAPSGARAASAGFFILEAADVAAMAPGTNTGAAHPVFVGMGQVDNVMKEKVLNDAAAYMRSFVSKRGRNVQVAESAVRESKSFTDAEALQQGLIDYVASNEQELFQDIASKPVKRFDGKEVSLNLVGKPVVPFEETLREQILGYLMDPNITFVLLAIGMLALYTEFNHPGLIAPGVIGAIAILLAVFALNLLPVRFAAVALILAAFVLFILEAKYTSHGVLGAGGVVAMVLGGLLLVDAPIPEMRVKLVTAVAVALPFGAITMFLMSLVLQAHRRKVQTGSPALIGEIGTAQSPLEPAGKVFVHGELWNAVSTVNLAVGEQVRVTGVDGLTLLVEPARTAAGSRQ
jgi:membrane-bound serine protease (ClpP class)